jgi:predicted amidohydrolase YtcJ
MSKPVTMWDLAWNLTPALRGALPLGVLLVVVLLAGACGPAVPPAPEPADLVLTNGDIVTVEEGHPRAEALAARGGVVVAVGSREEVEPYIGDSTRVLDLEGRLAVPGLIEGHGHFLGLGLSKIQLDLMPTKSWEEIVALVAERAREAAPGEWIEGRGWHQSKWTSVPEPNVEGLPVHDALSAVSPDNPVVLRHASGHASFANAKAMELAGITRDTPDPPGGEIVRDAHGDAIGMFRETAQALVARKTPPTEEELRRQVELASEEALSKGITSFQDAGSPVEVVELFKKLADEGALDLRLWVMLRDTNDKLAEALPRLRMVGYGGGFLTVRAIKHALDGALGSHGAWLLEPYTDLPTSTGFETTPLSTIRETAEMALRYDYQLCTHAIGDRANREILDLYEEELATVPDGRERRWRVEHAQHLNPADIPRFAELGVIASMQGVHCTSDGPWVPTRIGDERAKQGAYVWRKLIDSGAVVTNGTDTPVEDVNPIGSYYASVTRRLPDGSYFYPDQKMGREEALKTYTINAAYSAFEEDVKGSLGVGKMADVTVLSRDILTVPDDEIPGTRVVYTIVGGEVKYAREGMPAPRPRL